MAKNKKTSWTKVVFWLMIYLGMFFGGMVVGIGFEQRILFVGLGEALSYSNIQVNVNLNETKMVDEVTKNMQPILWNIRMENCTKTEKGYCALECYENSKLIPCENFTGDEHFCDNGKCEIKGICPTYYERLRGKTPSECIQELNGGRNSSHL